MNENEEQNEQVVPEGTPAGGETKPPVEQGGEKPKNQVVPTKHVTPAELVEHLDAENAEREEGEAAEEADQIQPYELVPEPYKEIAAGYTEDMKGIARDAGIPVAEAEVLLHFIVGGAVEAVTHDVENTALAPGQVPGVDLSNKQQCMSYITRKYGKEAPILIEKAVAAFKRLPKSAQDYLDHDRGTGELLTNSPHVILGLAMRELGYTRLTRDGAQRELTALDKKGAPLSDAESRRMSELNGKAAQLAALKATLSPAEVSELARLRARGPLSAFDLDKRKILRHIISRGNSSDHKGLTKALQDKRAPKVGKTGIEKQIAELRTHPAYFDASHASHKEVVAQVSELYRLKNGGK